MENTCMSISQERYLYHTEQKNDFLPIEIKNVINISTCRKRQLVTTDRARSLTPSNILLHTKFVITYKRIKKTLRECWRLFN